MIEKMKIQILNPLKYIHFRDGVSEHQRDKTSKKLC